MLLARFFVWFPTRTVQVLRALPFAMPTRKKAAIRTPAAPKRDMSPYPTKYPGSRNNTVLRMPILSPRTPERTPAAMFPMLRSDNSVPVMEKDRPYRSFKSETMTPLEMAQIPLRKNARKPVLR